MKYKLHVFHNDCFASAKLANLNGFLLFKKNLKKKQQKTPQNPSTEINLLDLILKYY